MPKTRIEIIYADDNIIVINKPSGVSVTRDRSGAAELPACGGARSRARRSVVMIGRMTLSAAPAWRAPRPPPSLLVRDVERQR
jgi:hypothetical protein